MGFPAFARQVLEDVDARRCVERIVGERKLGGVRHDVCARFAIQRGDKRAGKRGGKSARPPTDVQDFARVADQRRCDQVALDGVGTQPGS